MHSRLFHFAAFATCLMHSADKGGESGGGISLTLKQQLEQAQTDLATARAKVTSIDGEKTKLESEKTALEADKAQLAKDFADATTKVTALEGEKSKLSAEIAALKGSAKSADQLAAEKAAAHGILPVNKDAAGSAESKADGAALNEQYSKLKGRERTAFFREHEKALMAHAKEMEKQG